MQKLVEVRRRAATVQSIRSVASTMATVASAKLSRSRDAAAGIRGYTEDMRAMVRRQQAALSDSSGAPVSPFLTTRTPVRSVLLLHVTGDRGLCGAYNSAINRLASAFVLDRTKGGVAVSVIAKGMKGAKHLARRTDARLVRSAGWSRSGVTDAETDEIASEIAEAFMSGEADEVWCTYTRFYTPMRRYPTLVRLLPLAFEAAGDCESRDSGAASEAGVAGTKWFYEPDASSIMRELLGVLLRLQVEDSLLESYASEQGARMITMEEATERADRSLQDLTVAYNRLRRELITTDLLGGLFAAALREDPAESRVASEARGG